MDMTFEQSTGIFGTLRNKRYAVLVEDGKVKKVVVEPDNTGVMGMFSLLYGVGTSGCSICGEEEADNTVETIAEKVLAGLSR